MNDSSTNNNLENQTEKDVATAENYENKPQNHLEEVECKPAKIQRLVGFGIAALIVSVLALLYFLPELFRIIKAHQNWDGTGEDLAGWGVIILLLFVKVASPIILSLLIVSNAEYAKFSKSKSPIKKSTKIFMFVVYVLTILFSSPMLMLVGWFIGTMLSTMLR